MIKKEWLKKRTTIEECETKNLVEDKRLGTTPVPFGFINHLWLNLKRKIQEGDELWEYCSPPETWENLCGREGVCLVRGEEIIDRIITKMN